MPECGTYGRGPRLLVVGRALQTIAIDHALWPQAQARCMRAHTSQWPEFEAVATGGCHSFGRTQDGRLFSWGEAEFGQTGQEGSSNAPTCLLFSAFEGERVVAAHCGWRHSLIVTERALPDGGSSATEHRCTLWALGCNSHGQLGVLEPAPRTCMPVAIVQSSRRVLAVACGWTHSLMLCGAADGAQVFAWGAGRSGELGLGPDKLSSCTPCPVPLPTAHIRSIACGWRHSAALAADGAVLAWGSNQHCQQGTSDIGNESDTSKAASGAAAAAAAPRTRRPRPCRFSPAVVLLPEPSPLLVQLSSGWHHLIALDAAGVVWGWGRNDKGQLGLGHKETPVARAQPALLRQQAVQVVCGSEHSAAVDAAGALWTWGWNEHGNLGHGDRADAACPKRVEALAGHRVLHAAAGGAAMIVRAAAGTADV